MASNMEALVYWARRKNGYVYVFIRRNKPLPRSVTKHLDHEPDHNIEYWLADYKQRNGVKEQSKHPLADRWVKAVDSYLNEIKNRKSDKTISDHRHMLLDYVIPFFTVVHLRQDPNHWVQLAPKLSTYIREQTESEFQIQKANSALRGFWNWLQEENMVLGNVSLKLKKPVREQKTTPLETTLTPEEALAFVQSCKHPDISIMALAGYFFSLRPQETFALEPNDFKAGTSASELECCKVMNRFNQFGRLAVNITKQRDQKGKPQKPKAGSIGWVACFNEVAARLLVAKIREFRDSGKPFFEYQNDWLYERWKRHGIPNISLKDLRRASLYHLGHHVGLDFAALKSHARHSKPETTMLYLRRPIEELEIDSDLDLDA